MDFLEHYFNGLNTIKHTTIQAKMADDIVFLRQGSLSNLSQITDTLPCSISLIDRHYEVSWTRDGQPFVTIVFPAQYDLLLGMGQEQAQMHLKEILLSAGQRKGSLQIPSSLSLTPDCLLTHQTDTFELKSMNDAVYFSRIDSLPIFDANHPDYSAANLFHGLIREGDYSMYVEQSVYGMKTISYTLKLSQWLNYCAEWGLKVFFAVEEQREDGLLALVIAQSKELGFNHMLSVVIPDKFIRDTHAVMKVRMTPYIPIHNIKNLFQKKSVKHRKIKWQ